MTQKTNGKAIENLFVAKAVGDIGSDGTIELKNGERFPAKNLVSDDIKDEQSIVVVKCRETEKYYVYAMSR